MSPETLRSIYFISEILAHFTKTYNYDQWPGARITTWAWLQCDLHRNYRYQTPTIDMLAPEGLNIFDSCRIGANEQT